MVAAVEHADGSATMAQLAGDLGWKPYAGADDAGERGIAGLVEVYDAHMSMKHEVHVSQEVLQ